MIKKINSFKAIKKKHVITYDCETRKFYKPSWMKFGENHCLYINTQNIRLQK